MAARVSPRRAPMNSAATLRARILFCGAIEILEIDDDDIGLGCEPLGELLLRIAGDKEQ